MVINKLFGISPDIRFLKEMRDVLYDRKWLNKFSGKSLGKFPVYYMYRDIVKKETDRPKIEKADLRYDITIIPPKMFGIEYPKTLGHEHSLTPGTNVAYPEIYQVLNGQACFLQVKFDKEKNSADEVWAFLAGKNDIIITPLNCGHITINIAKKPLKMANWISRKADSDYSVFKNKKGGPYFVIKINNKLQWIKNEDYQNVPEIKFAKSIDPLILGLKKKEGMYNLANNLEKLDFLENPHNYPELFKTTAQ